MKIIIEDKVPFIRGVFEPVADVVYLPANDINLCSLAQADALITRTRPRLDSDLLENSPIKVIATATIGTDHVDLDFCARKGIAVYNAPGCNAPAVAQWVFASIFELTEAKAPSSLTLGVVGVGNVGKIVEHWGRILGFNVLLCDPPRVENESCHGFVDLNYIADNSDIITFHTPLIKTGSFPSFHLADKSFFHRLQRSPVVLNASRGPVVDTRSLVDAIASGKVSAAAVDCWEGEPHIDLDLLHLSSIATPHIAGYSIEGKKRATLTAIRAVSHELGLAVKDPFVMPPVNLDKINKEAIISSYDIMADSDMLKSCPEEFERLRDNYNLRNEA